MMGKELSEDVRTFRTVSSGLAHSFTNINNSIRVDLVVLTRGKKTFHFAIPNVRGIEISTKSGAKRKQHARCTQNSICPDARNNAIRVSRSELSKLWADAPFPGVAYRTPGPMRRKCAIHRAS